MNIDRIRGCLLGTAVGDALGRPVEGWDREAIGRRFGRIDVYHTDVEGSGEAATFEAGQWTDDTQFTFAIVDALAAGADSDLPRRVVAKYRQLEPRRWGPSTSRAMDRLDGGVSWLDSGADAGPTNGAAMRAAPFGVVWALRELSKEDAFDLLRPVMEITHGHPASVVAAFGQAFAVRRLLLIDPQDLNLQTFWISVVEMVDWAERMFDHADRTISDRLSRLEPESGQDVDSLLELTDGAGIEARAAWPFALAMFCTRTEDVRAALADTVSAGGDADTTGAMVGALAGALHGWSAFPPALQDGLDEAEALLARADALAAAHTV